MDDRGALKIRSYRLCFELERRIHRIDRWRIPVPYGLPLRGIAYGAGALLGVLLLQRLPMIGELLRLLHPALRLVALPIGVAYPLCQLRVDGRRAHRAALAWLRLRLGPRRLVSLRATPAPGVAAFEPITVVPDECSGRYRPALVRGPAELTLRYPALAARRSRGLELRQKGERPMWRGKRLRLSEGQWLRLR